MHLNTVTRELDVSSITLDAYESTWIRRLPFVRRNLIPYLLIAGSGSGAARPHGAASKTLWL
ncbi:MAG: hypothetical protein ACXWC5_30675 [Burkholderiales bacterium]